MKLFVHSRKIYTALILVMAIALCISSPCFAAGKKIITVRNAAEAMYFRKYIANGTIGISKATLYRENGPEEVYVITSHGVNSFSKTVNNALGSIKSGLSLDSDYYKALIKFVTDNIREGSKLVFIGHSFGGMISQQFSADKEMKEKYEILNVLCFGSPYVITAKKEGTLHRLADRSDVIPLISNATVLNFFANVRFENGGYSLLEEAAHTDSYMREDIWGEYDCFGIKGGTYYLEIDASTMIGYYD